MQTAFAQAKALDTAQRNAECYRTQVTATANLAPAGRDSTQNDAENHFGCATQSAKETKCYFCGFDSHLRFKCPAREATCRKCKKKGHYQRVCQSKTSPDPVTAAMHAPLLATATLQGVPTVLSKSSISVFINDHETKALVNPGSTDSFIHPRLVKACSLFVRPSAGTISLAADPLTAKILEHCAADIKVDSRTYPDVKLHVFPNLCADLILGQDWQSKHESVTIDYGGDQPPVKICNLTTLDVSPPSLFQHLSQDCKPIATKSRRYNHEDQEFVENETKRLLDEGIVEPSDSPWRAQVVVTKNERQKKRLVIDYSQTINKFTNLDAYPLPSIDETVNKIGQYRVFSTIDLKSAYHQVPLREEDKQYTAFEASNRLYQFRRIPFGVTNGVAAFQKIMNDFISDECLLDTFAY